MDISIITAQLVKEKVISHYPNSVKVLNGGTTSTIYLLDEQYVVKLNESDVIREEAYFLQFYKKDELFPKLFYKEPLNRYIVYSFLEGTTFCKLGHKRSVLFHNFIFQENKLHGVIDPLPVLGDSIYDLIYAFCSTPEDLTKETIGYAMKQCVFHKNDRDLYEEIVIGLYLRIDTCLRHHPKDLEDYLAAWRYWMGEVEVTL
ncbi:MULTISPECIES: aminoglycoside phosphotransferase family protein [Bacillus cereus group]|uniref:aminoglycoside phosphotransferase family protein n=1 Tax=Bacillus cereus group TaxID=86661 RepID=UPI001F58D234|nr:aminoglycoside phosphotransferase family protein [Bacillus cereus]